MGRFRESTDDGGETKWVLSDFICGNPAGGDRYEVEHPASFVATPIAREPVFLTTRVDLDPSDLTVDVFSWDHQGDRAPRIAFSWRCRVVVQPVHIIL